MLLVHTDGKYKVRRAAEIGVFNSDRSYKHLVLHAIRWTSRAWNEVSLYMLLVHTDGKYKVRRAAEIGVFNSDRSYKIFSSSCNQVDIPSME